MKKKVRPSTIVLLFFALFLVTGCGDDNTLESVDPANHPEANGKICDPSTYDLDCIKGESTAFSDEILDVFGDIKETMVEAQAGDVSDERQDQYGEVSKKEVLKEFPLVEGHAKQTLLEGLLHKLLKMRANPTKIDYNIYVIRSEMVNAFTVGGEIFVTTKLLDQYGSVDELACIIGHEIGHNELGHIADQIKEQELAEDLFGKEAGRELANAARMFTIGFNQKKEAESDIYGIDLAISSGYNACRGVDFWERMKDLEPEANEIDNFLRSHPYSEKRMKCYQTHLKAEHKLDCSK